MINQKALNIERSVTVAANAIELVTNVVRQVAGNDVSNVLHGETITMEALSHLVAARLNKQLSKKA